MPKRLSLQSRSSNGFSLVEIVVTTALFGVIMLILSQLAIVAGLQSLNSANRAFGQAAARRTIDRIRSDIRQAHNLGDRYGTIGNRLNFPSASNPIYKNGRAPVGGWPSAPWNQTMTLSDQILVLQTPVTYKDDIYPPTAQHGLAVRLEKNHFGPADPPSNMENWNTIVYEVVRDLERPNEYRIQVAEFPGAPSQITNIRTNTTLINPPKTLLRGLIGPILPGTNGPSVFSYVFRNQSLKSKIDDTDIDSVTGVGIDLELTNSGGNSEVAQGPHQQIVGVHGEEYLRSNKHMQFNNL